jgi:hypothetical protein
MKARWKIPTAVSSTSSAPSDAALFAQQSVNSFSSHSNQGLFKKRRGAHNPNQGNPNKWKPSDHFQGSQENRQSEGVAYEYCHRITTPNHADDTCRTIARHQRVIQEMAGLEKLKKEDNGAMAVYDTNNMDTPLLEQDFSLISFTSPFATQSNGDYFADSGATHHMTD